MKIAILDDSKEDLRQIKSVISSYYESLNTSADIRLYSSAESFFAKYSPGFYDLIIMDIYMGTMTGMDAARKLRDAKDTAALIFITSSDAYAVESYDVQASYYLMKPFDPEKLCRILSTIQLRQSQNSRYIELISDRTPVKILLQGLHRKYGSYRRDHRGRISHGQQGTCHCTQTRLQCHKKSISGILIFIRFR